MWTFWRYLGFNDPSVAEFQNLFNPQRCPKAKGYEWICPDLSAEEERNIAKSLSLSLGKCSISVACSEETLVKRGIIPSISFFYKEASAMDLNNSTNATLKGEKMKKEITSFIPPPPPSSENGVCNLTPQNLSVHQSSLSFHSSPLIKDIKSLDPVKSFKLALSLLSKVYLIQNLVSLSTFDDGAKKAERKVQELSLQLSKTIEYNSKMQRSLEDAKAKEREALDKVNAEMEKAKGLEKELSTAKEQIEGILDQGYKKYLKGLKDCRMFFACYNIDADIKVIYNHLKEVGVKFDDNKPNEANDSKTGIDRGGADDTRDTHLTKEISIVILKLFEDLFRRYPEQKNDDI
ncbi:hypothetical protein WN944_006631 [Citrus x changshan-huyou]|uniref:Uncharacterized protein n=1 Tax=Citrus x changshan-huyou TaxID=2935761 RepID=A0AAP0QTN6_9ROSI